MDLKNVASNFHVHALSLELLRGRCCVDLLLYLALYLTSSFFVCSGEVTKVWPFGPFQT